LQDCCRFYEAIGSRRVEGEVDPSAAPSSFAQSFSALSFGEIYNCRTAVGSTKP